MYIRAGHPAFARPYVGIHMSTSLLNSSLLLQQCPACLVCLTCIVFVMGGRWPYSWFFVGCEHFFVNTNFIEHDRHFLSTYFFSGSVRIAVLLLSYSTGIYLCIVHSYIYP